ncbi:MAG TPA: hypothetical protein VGQ36_09340 [Thermoanaerobaculia bacterium]|jgi:hypothetical protein|nr:hypothetical protein [Thermoanaerobaculia bacterium]
MSEGQVVGFLASLVIILGITFAEHRRWLPRGGKFKFVLVFLAGAAAIGSLRATGLPPTWFDGSKGAFGIAVMFLLSAFVGLKTPDQSFVVPFCLGLGGTLAVLNVLPHVS